MQAHPIQSLRSSVRPSVGADRASLLCEGWLSPEFLQLCSLDQKESGCYDTRCCDSSISVSLFLEFRLWYRIMYTVLGKRLNTIFTVSNFSRSELNKYFGIPKEKIHVTYNGVEHLKAIQPDDRILAKIPKDYVLAVSSQNPTKNFKLVLEAAEQLPDIHFVIAGGSNAKVFNGKEKKALPNVQYVGYVSDQELVSLYRHAMVFVYPSLYEGFGIPPLEALLNGCPAIVSNQASLPEICGDRVDYCNLKNTKSLVSKIIDIALKKKPAIQHLEKQIQERYSWKKSSAYLYAYYNDNRSK